MKTTPYYSINPTDRDVYHDYTECVSGQQIPPVNRRAETNAFPRCKHCQKLG